MNEIEQHIYYYSQVHLYSKIHTSKRLYFRRLNLRIPMELCHRDVSYNRTFELGFE